MSAATAAELGVRLRMIEDAALTTLLGSGTRIRAGWPADTMQATDFPRITFYCFGPAPLSPGVQRVRVTLDLWVWPDGTSGGRTKLLALDERILALFDEQEWTHLDHWLTSEAGAFRDFPAAPGLPLRRQRELVLHASALSAPVPG